MGYALAFIFFVCALDHLILWIFVGLSSPWLYLTGGVLAALICFWAAKSVRSPGFGIAPGRLVLACAVAAVLLMLGGEGRLFYANVDWQIRDAVMRDMAELSWPFAYTSRGMAEILRAPLGMYLVPSALRKLAGLPVDVTLLAQNIILFGLLFSTASVLYSTRRAMAIALLVFALFSGLDILGVSLLMMRGDIKAIPDHLENWSALQYSSHITQIFWVPQHAFAGWVCGLLFLLFRTGRIRVGPLLAAVPLLTLWSPLSTIGALPFAAYAGILALKRRELKFTDVLFPAATTLLSAPALLYLASGGDDVALGLFPLGVRQYLVFVGLEAIIFFIPLIALRSKLSFGRDTLILVAVCLVAIPFLRIGPTIDFTMRASMPALMILSLMLAEALTEHWQTHFEGGARRVGVGIVALLAVVTPGFELARALRLRPTPVVNCTLTEAAKQVIGLPRTTLSTYLAPVTSLPEVIRPQAWRTIVDRPNAACWSRPWKTRR